MSPYRIPWNVITNSYLKYPYQTYHNAIWNLSLCLSKWKLTDISAAENTICEKNLTTYTILTK